MSGFRCKNINGFPTWLSTHITCEQAHIPALAISGQPSLNGPLINTCSTYLLEHTHTHQHHLATLSLRLMKLNLTSKLTCYHIPPVIHYPAHWSQNWELNYTFFHSNLGKIDWSCSVTVCVKKLLVPTRLPLVSCYQPFWGTFAYYQSDHITTLWHTPSQPFIYPR